MLILHGWLKLRNKRISTFVVNGPQRTQQGSDKVSTGLVALAFMMLSWVDETLMPRCSILTVISPNVEPLMGGRTACSFCGSLLHVVMGEKTMCSFCGNLLDVGVTISNTTRQPDTETIRMTSRNRVELSLSD